MLYEHIIKGYRVPSSLVNTVANGETRAVACRVRVGVGEFCSTLQAVSFKYLLLSSIFMLCTYGGNMQNIDPIRQTHKRNVLTPDSRILLNFPTSVAVRKQTLAVVYVCQCARASMFTFIAKVL